MTALAQNANLRAPARAQLKRRNKQIFWLILPALGFIAVFLIIPYINILMMSLRPPSFGAPYGEGLTLGNYWSQLTDAYFLEVLAETFVIALLTVPICLLLGYPVALRLARCQSHWASVLYLLVLSPLLVGVVVRSFGWLIILSGNGVINQVLTSMGWVDAPLVLMNNRLGVVIALVHVFLPFMILPLVGVIQSVDPTLEQAARSLGASRLTAFWRITLPLSWPGIQAGTVLVFILTISAYVTPVMLGGAQVRTMPVLIVQNLVENFQWPIGAAQALLLSLAAIAAIGIYGLLTARIVKGVES